MQVACQCCSFISTRSSSNSYRTQETLTLLCTDSCNLRSLYWLAWRMEIGLGLSNKRLRKIHATIRLPLIGFSKCGQFFFWPRQRFRSLLLYCSGAQMWCGRTWLGAEQSERGALVWSPSVSARKPYRLCCSRCCCSTPKCLVASPPPNTHCWKKS